jgi:hypothetical protein
VTTTSRNKSESEQKACRKAASYHMACVQASGGMNTKIIMIMIDTVANIFSKGSARNPTSCALGATRKFVTLLMR